MQPPHPPKNEKWCYTEIDCWTTRIIVTSVARTVTTNTIQSALSAVCVLLFDLVQEEILNDHRLPLEPLFAMFQWMSVSMVENMGFCVLLTKHKSSWLPYVRPSQQLVLLRNLYWNQSGEQSTRHISKWKLCFDSKSCRLWTDTVNKRKHLFVNLGIHPWLMSLNSSSLEKQLSSLQVFCDSYWYSE